MKDNSNLLLAFCGLVILVFVFFGFNHLVSWHEKDELRRMSAQVDESWIRFQDAEKQRKDAWERISQTLEATKKVREVTDIDTALAIAGLPAINRSLAIHKANEEYAQALQAYTDALKLSNTTFEEAVEKEREYTKKFRDKL